MAKSGLLASIEFFGDRAYSSVHRRVQKKAAVYSLIRGALPMRTADGFLCLCVLVGG